MSSSAGRIDEISIHPVPVLFGSGTEMFQPLDAGHIQLELAESIESRDAVHLTYRIVKDA